MLTSVASGVRASDSGTLRGCALKVGVGLETGGARESGDVEQLADLLIAADNINVFLDGMTRLAAARVARASADRVECAVTLSRRKRAATTGGSTKQAVLLDLIEKSLGQGPCIEALHARRPVVLDDALSSPQWVEYCSALVGAGMRSTLGVPLELGENSVAQLNFFAPVAGVFTQEAVTDALAFAVIAGKALRVAIKITALNEAVEDLEAAALNRAAIDTACGVIISQSRCTHDEAFGMLRKASNDRNQKLHDLARTLVAGVSSHAAHKHDGQRSP